MFNLKLTSQESINAMKTVGILEQPFSEQQLKTAFREKIKIEHTDRGGNKDKAQKIIEAYDYLKQFAVSETAPETARRIKKEIQVEIEKDRYALYNDCEHCNGTGNQVYEVKIKKRMHKKVRMCAFCKGIGKTEVKTFNPVIEKAAVLFS